MNTRIYKDFYNHWHAKTTIGIGNSRELTISTNKNSRGLLVTTATVGTFDDRGMVSHLVYQDYCHTWLSNKKRVTEKAVSKQHQDFLDESIQDVIDDINRFYATKKVA